MTADEARARARDRLAVRQHNARLLLERLRARAAARSASDVLKRATMERLARRTRSVRKLFSDDGLILPRVWMYGPRWRSHFGVVEKPIAEIDPVAATLHRPGRKLLMFTLEEDVRDLVLVMLDNNRAAMWSDPREQMGL
jgi:hypothetical protein